MKSCLECRLPSVSSEDVPENMDSFPRRGQYSIDNTLRRGETMDLKRPFMVPRLNSDEYWKAYVSVPGGLFRSVTVQGTQSCDLYNAYMEEMTSRALLWSSILADFLLFMKWVISNDTKIHLLTIRILIYTFLSVIRHVWTIIMPFYGIFVTFQNLDFWALFWPYWKRDEPVIAFDDAKTSREILPKIHKVIRGCWCRITCP